MIARNRIWEEMKQAKSNILCLQKYADKRRARNRYYNMFIALTSSVGALGSTYNIIIPVYTSILVAFASIIKSIMPNFLQTESELEELDKLSDFYSSYLNDLENLWYKNETECMDEKTTMDAFFALKAKECYKQSILNRGIRNISKKLKREILDESEEYINRVYFTKT